MTLAELAWAGCNATLNVACVVLLIWHHRRSIVGPASASGRILSAVSDLRARVDILEKLAPLLKARLADIEGKE